LTGLGAGPSRAPNELIDALMAQCDVQNVLRQKKYPHYSQLHVGDQAQVTQDPFSGFVVTITEIGANNRIKVLLKIMGQSSKVATNAGANSLWKRAQSN
jgi:transcription antitermination factor NusG